MSQIEWKTDNAVGIERIDHQHQELLRIINSLIEHQSEKVDSAYITQLVKSLIDYEQEHFDYVEQLLIENNYPDTKSYMDIHLKFIESLYGLASRITGGEKDAPQDLLIFLESWWEEHLHIEGSGCIHFLKQCGCL